LEGLDDDKLRRPANAHVRAVLRRTIQETAGHDGHADIIREALDGSTGE
jgi:hypothetical protein